MIRTAWVYLVGGFATLYYAGGVVLRAYFWRRNLPGACDRAGRRWAERILRAAGVRVRVEGSEALRKNQPQIIVSNHQSWFDVFVLAARLPVRYRFVAKKELEAIPVFGRAWKSCGHVAVDRGDREAAIEAMDRAWHEIRKERLTMILFPEGTRSRDGRLQPFKKGAFVLAIQGQVPILPVAIVGSREVMPKGGRRIRSGTITLRIGSPISTEGSTIKDRNRLLNESWSAVYALKGEVSPTGDPDRRGLKSIG